MADNLFIGMSGRPSLQHFVPNALVHEPLGEGIQIGAFRQKPYRLNVSSLENVTKLLCK